MPRINNQGDAIDASLLRDQTFMSKCFNVLNKEVTIDGVTQPLKDFSKPAQHLFIYQNRLQQDFLEKKHVIKKQKIIEECAQKGNTNDAMEKQAAALNRLDLAWKESVDAAQLLLEDEKFFAGIQHLIARDSTANLIISQERVKEIIDSRVKFSNSTFEKITHADRGRIAKILEERYGEVEIDLINVNANRKELYVQFKDPEARELCIAGGVILELGNPSAVTVAAAAAVFSDYGIIMHDIRDDTTEQDVREALALLDIAPMSVNVYETAAYAYFNERSDFTRVLKMRRIRVNKRTVSLSPTKSCDPDELKGIVGFWNGPTTHLNELYKIVDSMEEWNGLLCFQGVQWPNGALRPYYFACFESEAAKQKAMWKPIQINSEVIQVHEIKRDLADRLVMPAEGEWRRKVRAKTTVVQMDEDEDVAAIPLRSFNR